MANIFDISQFKNLQDPVGSVSVVGSNSNLTVSIGNTGYTIQIAPLLQSILAQFSSAIREARVTSIDTSPIAMSDVLGLAKVDIHQDGMGYIDREANKIYVDVQKIANHAMSGMLPPIIQTPNESSSLDPDLKKQIAKKVYDAIAREIADTVMHEVHHKSRTIMDIREKKPISENPESEALSAGHEAGKKFNIPSRF